MTGKPVLAASATEKCFPGPGQPSDDDAAS